ncbi:MULTISPECIES: M20 aminoacylase family protein [unclassified Caballeronia]|uniref:M20 aminoacylase family protein n=1 Tax=unclassified Caballeronia TaxID=2646786 RepID=UPI002027B149|nr:MULTISPECIES: M20 aminoacylase family protein [unclassified Caballeronia]
MQIIAEIQAANSEIEGLRHSIHAHPELSFEEAKTAELVARKLSEWGIETHRGVGKTGVVGVLKRGRGSRSIGLRADMDALPVNELNGFEHRSRVPGKMHACGHDGHTAMLLGAARYLALHASFDGTVVFVFQPAEENGGGAQSMLDDGLFSRFPVDAIFGIHNWPGIPVGRFGVRRGPIMASTNEFRIEIEGVGCHAALPHEGRDPLIAAVLVANGLQTIVSRNKKPVDTAVLSVTQIHAGDASNVVPGKAWLGGTVRTFTTDTLNMIEARLRHIAHSTAKAHGCKVTVHFLRECPPTVNTRAEAEFASTVMAEVVGSENVDTDIEPTMGADDFAVLLGARPGCYAFLGNGDGTHRATGHGSGPCMLHNPSYDFNDELLPIGATCWVQLTLRFLGQKSTNTNL